MLKYIFAFFFPFLALSFAASGVALPETGAADAGADFGSDGGDVDLGSEGDQQALDAANASERDAQHEQQQDDQQQQSTEEPELKEFHGLASSRLRALTKQAPELSQVLQKYPKLRDEIEARFRRDFAYREIYPTIAEAREMREKFPNGLQDVQALEEEIGGVEQLDHDFYTREQDGTYPGHLNIITNMFQDNRDAAISLFKTLPKEWARLDRDSYNDVMGQIVGATIAPRLEMVAELLDAAKQAKQDGIAGGLTKLLSWMEGFLAGKPQPSAEEERLNRDRAQFNREKAERSKEEGKQFHTSFVSESKKLQLGIIQKHPAVERMLKAQNIPQEKKTEIVAKIRQNIEKFLGKSPSFMRKLRPAYDGRNMQESLQLQKSAWSQQWLLNRMVREVLRVETPAIVQQNRDSVRRRGGQPTQIQRPAKPAATTQKGPRQVGGRWFKEDGTAFTTAEVIAGKHLS